MINQEKRKKGILEKWGSFENYERERAKKTRETALARCSSEKERQKKLKHYKG